LKSDDSFISNPKSEIATWTGSNLRFRNFGFEMGFCPISKFLPLQVTQVCCCPSKGLLYSPVYKFPCALRRPDDRFDQCDAQTAVFQFKYSVNGATGRRRHDVLELGRMLTGL